MKDANIGPTIFIPKFVGVKQQMLLRLQVHATHVFVDLEIVQEVSECTRCYFCLDFNFLSIDLNKVFVYIGAIYFEIGLARYLLAKAAQFKILKNDLNIL